MKKISYRVQKRFWLLIQVDGFIIIDGSQDPKIYEESNKITEFRVNQRYYDYKIGNEAPDEATIYLLESQYIKFEISTEASYNVTIKEKYQKYLTSYQKYLIIN